MQSLIRATTAKRSLTASTSTLPFSTSSHSRAEAPPQTPTEATSTNDAAPPTITEPTLSKRDEKGFTSWLNGEGSRFRNGIKGSTNWIGDTPFPLNPSFRPLPPLSDLIKTKIYNAYVSNLTSAPSSTPTESVVIRAISSKFGVATDRVRAVIRLKGLEKRWRDEGKTMQTNLVEGMESHLGVKLPKNSTEWRGKEVDAASEDVEGAQREGARTVFEMVDYEGNDAPVLLPLLSHLKARSATQAQSSTIESKKKEQHVPAKKAGRAGLLVRDLGGEREGKVLRETYGGGKKRGRK